MPILSNVIASLTIQDQDLIGPVLANLVNRTNATVTLQASTAVVYAGYLTVSATVTIVGTSGVPFVYVRNANPSGTTQLVLTVQGGGFATATNLVLNPGGIFIFGNPNASSFSSSPLIQNVSVAAAPGSGVVIVEYLYAS